MKVIGWIGISHVGTILVWMVANIIVSRRNPIIHNGEATMAQVGLEHYSNLQGFLGFDHGSKALILLLSIGLPIGLYIYFKDKEDFQLQNITALVTGCLGFALYSLSLMLQAVTVEYAFNLYRSTKDASAHAFAHHLYDWAMLEGGLSVSIYILANLLLSCWIILHSSGFYKFTYFNKLGIFGFILGALQIVGYLIAWFFLMQANQIMHELNEGVGLLFLVWIFIVSMKLIKGDLAIPLQLHQTKNL